jgi:hypothetical protein
VSVAQATTWLGHGAHPYPYAEGAPGEYYVPSAHPYQTTLTDGVKVQEAYPGQYYVLPGASGVGSLEEFGTAIGGVVGSAAMLMVVGTSAAAGALYGAVEGVGAWRGAKIAGVATLGALVTMAIVATATKKD